MRVRAGTSPPLGVLFLTPGLIDLWCITIPLPPPPMGDGPRDDLADEGLGPRDDVDVDVDAALPPEDFFFFSFVVLLGDALSELDRRKG